MRPLQVRQPHAWQAPLGYFEEQHEMGFDVSFHPIDVRFVQQEIIPFVLGEFDLTMRFDEAARIARNRYRANAWGLAAANAHAEQSIRQAPEKPSFLSRLFGKSPSSLANPLSTLNSKPISSFGADPFFIDIQELPA